MGFLIALIAVIVIIVTGGNRQPTADEARTPEPRALVQEAPAAAAPPPPPEFVETTPISPDELEEQHAALELQEEEEIAPTEPNPCDGQDGTMIPNCAAIARRTGEYVLTRQNRLINEWVHTWTR